MNNLWVFGDSWAEGWGLKRGEKNFAEYLNLDYKLNLCNRGKAGSSLGLILNNITANLLKFKKEDLVFVLTPPDTRWYVKRYSDSQWLTLHRGLDDYDKFIELMKLDNEWFRYHHNLFIYSIQKILIDVEAKFVLAHNYGQIELLPEFENLIDKNLFLDINRSLTTILGAPEVFKSYKKELIDGPSQFRKQKYFIKNDNHPNERGHKRIADLLRNKLNELYFPATEVFK